MKIKRQKLGNRKEIGTMKFVKGPAVILDFGEGTRLKYGTGFIADAIEHYIEFCLSKALEYENATKKRKK